MKKMIMLAMALTLGVSCQKSEKPTAKEPLRIVKKALFVKGNSYEVRGIIHNPRSTPAEEVRISFKMIEKNYTTEDGKDIDRGSKSTVINYLPAGASVDFVVPFYLDVGEINMVKTDPGTISEK